MYYLMMIGRCSGRSSRASSKTAREHFRFAYASWGVDGCCRVGQVWNIIDTYAIGGSYIGEAVEVDWRVVMVDV